MNAFGHPAPVLSISLTPWPSLAHGIFMVESSVAMCHASPGCLSTTGDEFYGLYLAGKGSAENAVLHASSTAGRETGPCRAGPA